MNSYILLSKTSDRMKTILRFRLVCLIVFANLCHTFALAQKQNILICTYYFEGWAGHRANSESWNKNAPTHLTEKLQKQFPGREPIWGWRDDNDDVMKRQINLAHDNGVDCFFFDWYWADSKKEINVKKIEEKPTNDCISRFLKVDDNYKMKFALMIANHSGAEIVGKDNWLKAIDYFSDKYFKKNNYLKVDGKPVIAVFSPKAIYPYLEDVRKEVIKLGYPDIYIISLGYDGKGFDAYSWYNTFETVKNSPKDIEKPYKDLISFVENKWSNQYPNSLTFPIVMAGWDRRPWQEKVLYYSQRSPKLFYSHLSNAADFVMKEESQQKMIFIYAWNEMGEGGYLVPTKDDKKGAYLKKIRKLRKRLSQKYN